MNPSHPESDHTGPRTITVATYDDNDDVVHSGTRDVPWTTLEWIELEPVLDLLERVAPKLSYAPRRLTRVGEQPEPKERWLRDEIETLLREHGRLNA